jgi:hypothetical protein
MSPADKGLQVLEETTTKMKQPAKEEGLPPRDQEHQGLEQAPGLHLHKLPSLRTQTGKQLATPPGNLLGLAHRLRPGVTPIAIGLPIGTHVGGPTALPPGNQTLGMLGTRTNGSARTFLFATPVTEAPFCKVQAAN